MTSNVEHELKEFADKAGRLLIKTEALLPYKLRYQKTSFDKNILPHSITANFKIF